VEEALYTGWILVRPSVSRPHSQYRHCEHRKHSHLSEIAIISGAVEEDSFKTKRIHLFGFTLRLDFSVLQKRDNL